MLLPDFFLSQWESPLGSRTFLQNSTKETFPPPIIYVGPSSLKLLCVQETKCNAMENQQQTWRMIADAG